MFNRAFEIFINNQSLFIRGIQTTLLVSLLGTFFGLLIGFVLSALRSLETHRDDSKLTRVIKLIVVKLTNFYIDFVRGTPMLVQAVFLYYSLYKTLKWSPLVASLVIVSFNTATYLAEILRAGIQSIPKGQTEAALALGMTKTQVFRKIILPQALRNSFPAIGNEFIVNIKDTSVLNAISLTELFYQGMAFAGRTFEFSESMLVLLVIYFILTFTTGKLLSYIERKLQRTKKIEVNYDSI